MTNKEMLINGLMNDDLMCLKYYLMCPFIQGEPGAWCNDPDKANYRKDCVPCLIRWLSMESEQERSEQDGE